MSTQTFKLPTSAQRWAQRRNFYLFKLKGARSIINPPDDLLDIQLRELTYQADKTIKEMISRVERLNSSYKTRVRRG